MSKKLAMAVVLLVFPLLAAPIGCRGNGSPAEPVQAPEPDYLPKGLLLGLSVFEKGPKGPVPQPARLDVLIRREGKWIHRSIEDPASNVLHKAMAYSPMPGEAGILTAGGTRAILKLWKKGAEPEIIWEADFGGDFSRMREMEAGDLFGDGSSAIAVATHDQGVVAVVRPNGAGGYLAEELDREADTIVHEIEIGDLDGDGVQEIYATPSLPNKLDGTPQAGQVVRYIPAKMEGRVVVADLGSRHAKEILVSDVDGDGRDELYVSVEAVAGGQVEILRFDAGTEPRGGMKIASLEDRLCRFLTTGDIDGDGRKEMVAASHKSGIWLLRAGENPHGAWSMELIDADSQGFEHAAILADLDGDTIDELYVANDRGHEVNRYVWREGTVYKTTIHEYPAELSYLTWNITAAPVDLIP